MNSRYVVFGLYRSGTHYLQQVIDKNLLFYNAVPELVLDRKHEYNKKHLPDLSNYVVTIVHKSPCKWIDSISRESWELSEFYPISYQPYHTPLISKCSSFLNANKYVYKVYSIENLCHLYNNYFNFWFNQTFVTNLKYVKHHDLITNFEDTLNNLNYPFQKQLVNVENVKRSRPFNEQIKKQYLEQCDYDYLTTKHIEVINKTIDKNILQKLNYQEIY